VSLAMSESPATADTLPFVLKGRSQPLLTLELRETHTITLVNAFRDQFGTEAPPFDAAPAVIDLSAFNEGHRLLDFPAVTRLMRNYGLIAVGVRAGNLMQREAAVSAGLALFAEQGGKGSNLAREEAAAPPPAQATATDVESAPALRPPLILGGVVRGGQRHYAAAADLVVEGAVSAGAEVMADGSIHVYGALRGRALAGARGQAGAVICTLALEAELVSIDGYYLTREGLPADLVGKPATAWLEGTQLRVRPLHLGKGA